MITQCLLWSDSRSNRKTIVTPGMASMAHGKFVGNINGCDSEIINLKKATEEFGDWVMTLVKQVFVDVTLEFTAVDMYCKNQCEQARN